MCAFEDAARYANQRVQFGEAIGRFPVDSGKIRPHRNQIKLHEKHAV
ncbi:hypothetical protein ACNKHT_00240 [Shigella flexneri]